MKYRKFGKHDFNVSALGFGCMRLPVINGDEGCIDETEAIKMVRYAIDKGVNYIDTAYPYHKGNSEAFVGKALKDGYRERVKLATKLPSWLIKEYSDFEKFLNLQLERLQTNSIDMYLLHALDKENWEKINNLNVLKFVDEAKASGKIKYAGFSFHDNVKLFKEIVDSYDWDFCQIQYNYMDEYHQAGTEGLKYAASKGIAVIIMEPLRGGRLAANPPEAVKKIWDSAEIKHTPADWALRWILNHPEVTVVLSGMSTMSQVDENIKTMETALSNSLSSKEIEIINNVRDTYKSLSKVGCTGCNYCMPCPAGVDIPENFSIYNQSFMYNALEYYKKGYASLEKDGHSANKCLECGKCEEACPQKLEIRKALKEVHNTFTK